MFTNPSKPLVKKDDSILHALKTIDKMQLQIALVVDDEMRLLGTVTDGDIRRAFLNGKSFDDPIGDVMNSKPALINESVTRTQALSLMRKKQIHQLPVVDNNGILIGLHLDSSLQLSQIENEVILMAGGVGKRLNELTENCPKPMLKIGAKPILETILDNFIEAGFHKFTISLGYLGEMISDYFGDGRKWGVDINYVNESEPLGTAGALSLLKKKPSLPFIIMNGDLLTRVDFKSLLQFHREQKSVATMCVRGFEHNIPYGVVKTSEHIITSLEEKPIQSVLVNAGIYILDPQCLDYIPKNKFYNMTSLFEELITGGKKPAAFPIHEYWIDIGRPDEFTQAGSDYSEIFAGKNGN